MCAARVRDIAGFDGLNLELFFVTEILKLRSLHYGYWEETPERIDLDSVRQAQADFTERLLSHIPPGVQKILGRRLWYRRQRQGARHQGLHRYRHLPG